MIFAYILLSAWCAILPARFSAGAPLDPTMYQFNLSKQQSEALEDEIQVLISTSVAKVNTSCLYLRSTPDDSDLSNVVKILTRGEMFQHAAHDDKWSKIMYEDEVGYVQTQYLAEVEDVPRKVRVVLGLPNTPLNRASGRVLGPSGPETYYNLPMQTCIDRMHSLGYEGEYWVRDDGVKMFGNYIMVAADFKTRPLGTILETSLGLGIVVDTGAFVEFNPTQIDVAVTW